MNKSIPTFLLLILCCFLFSIQTNAQNSRKELEQQRKEIQKEIRTIRSLLSQTKTEEQSLLTQLNQTNIRIVAQEKLIAVLNAETKSLNSEIVTNKKQIKKLEADLKDLKDDYAKMIYRSYKSKSKNNRIMFILSSENFYQAYKRTQYMKQYTDFRKAQGEQISKKSDLLNVKNDTLLVQKKEKDVLVIEEKEAQEKLEEKKKGQEEIVSKIKKKEKKYISEIKKKQNAERKIDQQIEKIIRDAIAKSNKKAGSKSTNSSKFALTAEAKLVATQFEGNKGKLPWPVEKGFVALRFGTQKHPTLPGITIESNGVRIRTEKGAHARAIYKGTVLQIQSVSGKKALYIQHGNYITIYNNLETVLVKKGEKVSVKQDLGKVFTDKVTNKTTLKFQLWKNTTRLNPALWIYKM
ncbi:MAG: peptidase M23 [Flavobacteriaceae bacterium]|nr:MAG: peptidase M23 [Flavobacteriaceae bacterium]